MFLNADALRVALIFFAAAKFASAGEVVTLSVPKPGEHIPDLIRMIDRDRGWSRTVSAFFRTGDGGRTWTKAVDTDTLGPSWGVAADGGVWSLTSVSSKLIRIPAKGEVERLPVPCNDGCYAAAADFDSLGQKGLLFGLLPLEEVYTSQIVVFCTLDGGRTWALLKGPDTKVFRGDLHARMIGPNDAIIAASCELFTTSNFGQSWKRSSDGDSGSILCSGDSTPFAVHFVSPRNGWLRTDDGWILQTTDGGMSWQVGSLGKQHVDFPSTLDDWVAFADELDGLIVVEDGVLATEDGGKTWAPIAALDKAPWAVSCAAGRCVLVSEHRIAEYIFDKR